jgi:hypothetical protein
VAIKKNNKNFLKTKKDKREITISLNNRKGALMGSPQIVGKRKNISNIGERSKQKRKSMEDV